MSARESIHALPGATWVSRYRFPGCEVCYQSRMTRTVVYHTDWSEVVVWQSCKDPDPLHGGPWTEALAGGKMLPLPVKPPKSNAGEQFYATLRKLGCQKDAGGDYKLLS